VEPAGAWPASDRITLHPTPEWLAILRQVGVDMLAYDGARAADAYVPFADAAWRIQDDPGVRHPWWPATGLDVVELLWEAARLCARSPAATFSVQIRDADSTR
jgi:hypothetical protein